MLSRQQKQELISDAQDKVYKATENLKSMQNALQYLQSLPVSNGHHAQPKPVLQTVKIQTPQRVAVRASVSTTKDKPLHWMQRPENKARVLKQVKKMARMARTKRRNG